MPLTFTVEKSPRGRTFVRTVSSGAVTADDAKHFIAAIGQQQPLSGAPILAIVESGADLAPEARKAFTSMGGDPEQQVPVAVVVTSAPLRVLLTFVIRMSGAALGTKFFGNEVEAKRWLVDTLDTQVVDPPR